MRIASFSFFHSETMKEGTSSRAEQYSSTQTPLKLTQKAKAKLKQKKISVSLSSKKFTSLSLTHC